MISRFYLRGKELFIKMRNPQLSTAFRIKSHLTAEERIALYRLALEKRNILEIGSYLGASACCFGAAVKRHGLGRIYCIDTWQNDTMTEGKRDTWQAFQENTMSYKGYILPLKGFSSDLLSEVAAQVKSIDLLFVDGDHSYAGVKADWEAYRGFLTANSVIAFHDWGWAEGVQRVIREDVQPLLKDYDSLPNLWWGTLQ